MVLRKRMNERKYYTVAEDIYEFFHPVWKEASYFEGLGVWVYLSARPEDPRTFFPDYFTLFTRREKDGEIKWF